MNAHFPRPDAFEPVLNDLDQPSVEAILVMLDSRAISDRLSAIAARIIRSQAVTILSLDNEVVEAEWRAMAHAVEIDRLRDPHRGIAVPKKGKKR